MTSQIAGRPLNCLFNSLFGITITQISELCILLWVNTSATGGFPSQWYNNAQNVLKSCRQQLSVILHVNQSALSLISLWCFGVEYQHDDPSLVNDLNSLFRQNTHWGYMYPHPSYPKDVAEILHSRSLNCIIMTSSHGIIFRVTGHLCGWIHQSPVNSPNKGQWRGALMFSLICTWINGWVNNRAAGDLTCYLAHYGVTVMM